jgi:cytochrome c553
MARKRELIARGNDKRYVRRDASGRFTTDQVDVGRSLAADRRQHLKAVCARGHGNEGDRARRGRSS